jgi:hypothetical protein
VSETVYVAGFDYPEAEWIQLDMASEDAAERAAQQIADRGGTLDQVYAEAAYPELKAITEGALERNASPVAVFVPFEPGESRPMVPMSAFVTSYEASPAERNLDFLAAFARQPRPFRFREPHVETVDLPAGPAVRVHELVVNEKGDDDRQVMMEYVTHYVASPTYPDGVVEMTVTWSSPTIGPIMAEVADDMAATLTVERREAHPQSA